MGPDATGRRIIKETPLSFYLSGHFNLISQYEILFIYKPYLSAVIQPSSSMLLSFSLCL